MSTASRTRNDAGLKDGFRLRDIPVLLVLLAATLGTAAVGSIATRDGMSWYDGLEKPSFNPPGWVFGPVWTVLYVLMAAAAWLVWRKQSPGRKAAMSLWGVQLALNLGWSWIFFGAQRPGAALVEIYVLLAAILATTFAFFRISRLAAVLMLPYAAWVSFASVLNLRIWQVN